MCRRRFLFWQYCWRTHQKCDFIRSDSRNIRTISLCFQNVYFSSKKSFQQLECSVDNTVKKFLLNDRRCFTRSPKMLQKLTFFKKKFHGIRFSGPIECTVNNLLQVFLPDAQTFFAHDLMTKNVKLWVPLENVFLPKTLHSTHLLKQFQKKLHWRSSPGQAECKCDKPA